MSKFLLRGLPFVVAMTLASSLPISTATAQNYRAMSCNDLWLDRNGRYADVGYCFKGERGKAEFGNAGCHRNESEARRAMGSSNRRDVDRIKAEERRRGC